MTELKIMLADNAKATFVFGHGAGADMHHPFMTQMTQLLLERQINVLRFNFPFMSKRQLDGKRRPPDKMPVLLSCFEAMIAQAPTALPVFIGGKSMGGRVAATLSSEQVTADVPVIEGRTIDTDAVRICGVVCLGYPFHPVNSPEKLRLQPLTQAQKPVLIVQGQRDALGSEAEINGYKLPALCQLHVLDDGDHDFKPRVKSGFSQQQHLFTAAAQISRFIDEKK